MGGEQPDAINLVGFAVPKTANDDVEEAWLRTPDGRGMTFADSYGASGDQSRAVEAGKRADYVHFSLSPDVNRLVKAGLVAEDWNARNDHGIVTQSIVVLVVRKGNPLHIRDWDDIIRPGVGIVSANPGSSGSARWNILAAWAHATAGASSPRSSEADEAGTEFLRRFFDHAVVLTGSGREATTAFQNGAGDVLVSYENEAIFARQHDVAFDYVVPSTSILIENPGTTLIGANPAAERFLEFVRSEPAQRIYAKHGFRPLGAAEPGRVRGAMNPADPYPTPARLLTAADYGGWSDINKRFFATKDKDGTDGVITVIQNQSGKGNS